MYMKFMKILLNLLFTNQCRAVVTNFEPLEVSFYYNNKRGLYTHEKHINFNITLQLNTCLFPSCRCPDIHVQHLQGCTRLYCSQSCLIDKFIYISQVKTAFINDVQHHCRKKTLGQNK
jgi:hypothetical protein